MTDSSTVERLVSNEGVQSTGRSDDDVRASGLVLEELLVDLDGRSSVEYSGSYIGHVLAESGVFVLDLVRELSGMTENDDRDLPVDGLDLLEGGRDEDGGFT